MNKNRVALAFGLTLALASATSAAPTTPGTSDPIQVGWQRTVSQIKSIVVQNSSGAGNPAGTWYWLFARNVTLGAPSSLTTGDAAWDDSTDFVGDRKRSAFHLTANTGNAGDIYGGGAIASLAANVTYDVYAQACNANNYNNGNCSNWVKLRTASITTLNLPSLVFKDPLIADVGNASIAVKVDGAKVDATDVLTGHMFIRDVDAGNVDSAEIFVSPFSLTFTIDNAQYASWKPNNEYRYLGRLEYPYSQFTAQENKGPFVTTPVDPGTNGAIVTITHFTATIPFKNAAGAVGNPTNTTYRVNIYNQDAGGAFVKSVDVVTANNNPNNAMSAFVNGLLPNTNYRARVQAIGKRASDNTKWNDSTNILIGDFKTLPFTLSIAISAITTTDANARLTVNSSVGIDHFVLTPAPHAAYGATSWVGGAGGDPNAQDFSMTGLTSNTAYTVSAILCETNDSSQCSGALPVPAVQFFTLPFAPTGGSFGAITATSVVSNWSDASNPIGSAYHVQYSATGGAPWTDFGPDVAKPTLSKTITGLAPETTYTVRVKTVSASGNAANDSAYLQLPGTATTLNQTPSIVSGPTFTLHTTSGTLTVTATDNASPANLSFLWTLTPSGTGNPALTSTTGNTTIAGQNATNVTQLTFNQSGAYSGTLTVTDHNGTGLFVTVPWNTSGVPQVPTTIDPIVAPSGTTIVVGFNKAFNTVVRDQFGSVISGQGVNWTLSNGAASRAPASGTSTTVTGVNSTLSPVTLTAALPGLTPQTLAVTIIASGPQFTLDPTITLNPDGITADVSALATDNSPGAGSMNYSWTLESGPAAISVTPNNSTSANNATVTFNKAGAYVLRCTITDNFASDSKLTSSVDVNQSLVSITVCPSGQSSCPSSITLRTLQNQQFIASGTDQFGNPMTVGSVHWSADAGSVISSGGGSASFSASTLGQPIRVTATDPVSGKTGFIQVSLVSYDVTGAFAYPVPYKDSTAHNKEICFRNIGSSAKLRIFTPSGRKVLESDITPNASQVGRCEYSWDLKNSSGESVASGVYFYVIESPEGKKDGKLIIIK